MITDSITSENVAAYLTSLAMLDEVRSPWIPTVIQGGAGKVEPTVVEHSQPAPVFKSVRSAKVLFGKAQRRWYEAKEARIERHQSYRADGLCAYDAIMKPLLAAEDAAFADMVRIYETAKAQGIYIRSFHLGSHATRDLIAANID